MNRRDIFDELKGELKKRERKKRGELSPEVDKVAEFNNAFTIDLYGQLKKGKEIYFSHLLVFIQLLQWCMLERVI